MTTDDTAPRGRRRWLVPVIAIVLTVIAGGTMLWAVQTRQGTAPVVPVAIVNEDKPVTTGSGKDQKNVAAGRQLAAGLTQPAADEQTPLSWHLVDKEDAAKGLVDGDYFAVLTIPESFSKDVTSTSGSKPTAAQLKLVKNDASSVAVGALAQLAVDQAAVTLGQQVTSNYTDQTLQSFTSIHNSLTSSAKSAHQVDDSAHQLASSSEELATSSKSLADGAANLYSGSTSLVSGLKELQTGADQAAGGAADLAQGARKLDSGAEQLATGADRTAAGAKKLAAGADTLAGDARRLPKGAAEVAAGAAATSKGASALSRGNAATSKASSVLSRGTTAVARDLAAASRVTDRSAIGTDRLATLTERLADSCERRTGDRVFCAELQALGRDAAAQARLARAGDRLVGPAATATDRIATAASRVATANAKLSDVAKRVDTAASGVASGAKKVASGSAKVAAGSRKLASSADDLSTGARSVARGADNLADSTGSLASGAADLASGTESVAGGVAQNEAGAENLSSAADQLKSGASQLSSGNSQLASGADQLADGTKQLADGLDNGAKSVPSYTDDQRKALVDVVTTPVGVKATADHGSTVAAGLVPAVIGIALWLGTLMMFLTSGAVPGGPVWSQASAGRRTLWGWWPAVLVGLVQVALMVGLLKLVAIPIHSPVGFALFCGLGALAFAATNQALVSAFGGIGRLVSLAIVVVEGAAIGGVIPIQTAPALLQGLNGVLPLPQFVNGAGQLLLGGVSGGLVGACVVLALWTLGALAVTAVTTARRHPRLAPAPLPDPPRAAVPAGEAA